jgi:hypothetical protein
MVVAGLHEGEVVAPVAAGQHNHLLDAEICRLLVVVTSKPGRVAPRWSIDDLGDGPGRQSEIRISVRPIRARASNAR